jgi:threonine dehydrogenase-like Zn-dependent dehydrogenase
MNALQFIKILTTFESPLPSSPRELLIRVSSAGICNTDIEITRGYVPGFSGIPGHEFFGYVESVPYPVHNRLIGKRVTAEINCACGNCSFCNQGLSRHCRNRTVIGIVNRDGAFAEYISVPVENVVLIPDTISDNNSLFIEPLAAALEIQEQVKILPEHEVLILGDGKLAHLVALTLKPTGCRMKVSGRHEWKAQLLRDRGIDALVNRQDIPDRVFDIVIEASGSPAAFQEGLAKVKPRGTLVLKSTYVQSFSFNPASVVVNEITLIGSRCGRFAAAIAFLEKERPDLSYLISKRFPLVEGIAAFAAAQQPDVMKVVIDCR